MIAGEHPVYQAFLATLLTWGLTALGAIVVYCVPPRLTYKTQRLVLDAALGFAAGVMLAASYWSLLKPAIEFAESSGIYGKLSFVPSVVGVLLGAAFVWGADKLIPHEEVDPVAVLAEQSIDPTLPVEVDGPDDATKLNERLGQSGGGRSPVSGGVIGTHATLVAASNAEEEDDSKDDICEIELHDLQGPAAAALERSRSRRSRHQNAPPNVDKSAATPASSRRGRASNRSSPRRKSSGSRSRRSSRRQSKATVDAHDHDHASDLKESKNDESRSERKTEDLSMMEAGGMEESASLRGEKDGAIHATSPKKSSPSPEATQSRSIDASPTRKVSDANAPMSDADRLASEQRRSWHRILLLVVAIALHNFPEGLAVGVGFGALGTLPDPAIDHSQPLNSTANTAAQAEYDKNYMTSFNDARNLAVGIGLQNLPEGLAVSLPLIRIGLSRHKAFFYGQLSGMVEPLGGLLGAGLIQIMEPVLPYALAFAAGAMIFVVFEDIVPETRVPGGYPQLASCFLMIGFCIMMAMDVGLG